VSKNNIMKVGGFIGSLAIGAALVGSAVTGTGAWFSDSHNGHVAASTGRLHLNTTDTNLSFDNLVPGEYKTRNIDFSISGDSSTNADVWLTFDPNDLGYLKFTGAKNVTAWPDGGLGRYGHFAVSVNGGAPVFRSYNLRERQRRQRPAGDQRERHPAVLRGAGRHQAGVERRSRPGRDHQPDLRANRQVDGPGRAVRLGPVPRRRDPGRGPAGRGELLIRS
jgi:hypothetical protein